MSTQKILTDLYSICKNKNVKIKNIFADIVCNVLVVEKY